MVAAELTPKHTDPEGKPLELVLYQHGYCRYCRRVLERARELGIELELRDTVRHPEHRQRLVELGGKRQVPCLFINGAPMYESADIIEFLETRVQ